MIAQRENFTNDLEIIRGLCVTCNNSSTCSFRASDSDRVIWYCELFDCFVEVEELLDAAKAILESQPIDEGYSEFKGLCMNCRNCMTCTFPKPEGGIWHCEEYE